MLLTMWYYFFGYIIINVEGYGLTRLMNMLSYKGIFIWDTKHNEKGLIMKVSSSSLDIINECCEKTGCHAEIIRFGGLPYFFKNAMAKPIFSYGILFFVGGLCYLSTLVWSMEVTGANRINENDIINYCEDLGINAGVSKKDIDTKEITSKLMNEFSDISWVSVGMKGTKLEIQISETIDDVNIIDKNSINNIISTEKGVVTQITVERGTPLVKENDIIEIGDILISSEVVVGDEDSGIPEEIHNISAEGQVFARVWRQIEEVVDLIYIEKIYTGNTTYNWVIEFGNYQIDFIKPTDFLEYEVDVVEEFTIGIGDFSLGISLIKQEFSEYEITENSRSEEQAKLLIESNIRDKLESSMSNLGIIENLSVDFKVSSNSIKGEGVGVIIESVGVWDSK